MEYWTWGEIRDKVEKDYDIQEDPDFLAEGELCEYLNEAINKVEQHFIKLPGYFEASGTITLVAGTRDYDLPDDIYATKIRNIVHDTEYYEVKHLKNIKDRQWLEQSSGAALKYRIINNSGSAPKIRFYPTPDAAGTLTIDYIRNATRIDPEGVDGQEVDIPEAMGYIFTYIRWKLELKEKLYQIASQTESITLKSELQDLLDALAVRIDDENNEIEPETGEYDDHI